MKEKDCPHKESYWASRFRDGKRVQVQFCFGCGKELSTK